MSESRSPISVSVIIATYRAAESLERCLLSVIGQKDVGWELLVADGGSDDGTLDVLKRHEESLAWWHSSPDNGIYDAWNRAIPHARGEYITFLGADDALQDSHALYRLLREADVSYDLISSRGQLLSSRRVFGDGWNYRRIGRRMPLCHPGLLHHRSLFSRHGLFDTSYRITGDLDFLLRLPEGLRTLHVDSITAVVGEEGVSRRKIALRLREQRMALSRCPRFGPVKAWLAWADKMWRLPIARLLGLSH